MGTGRLVKVSAVEAQAWCIMMKIRCYRPDDAEGVIGQPEQAGSASACTTSPAGIC
jgi:hypothetical protein